MNNAVSVFIMINEKQIIEMIILCLLELFADILLCYLKKKCGANNRA